MSHDTTNALYQLWQNEGARFPFLHFGLDFRKFTVWLQKTCFCCVRLFNECTVVQKLLWAYMTMHRVQRAETLKTQPLKKCHICPVYTPEKSRPTIFRKSGGGTHPPACHKVGVRTFRFRVNPPPLPHTQPKIGGGRGTKHCTMIAHIDVILHCVYQFPSKCKSTPCRHVARK